MRLPRLPSVLLLGFAAATACAADPPPPASPPPAPLVRAPDWAAAAVVPEPAERRILDLRIAPVAAAGAVDHLDVGLSLSEPPGELGDPAPLLLRLTQAEGGEPGWPETIEEMYARDAEGALVLRTHPGATRDGEPCLEWRPDRRPVGAIHVSYRVRLAHAEGGRYQGTRAHARGFEGTGATFLVLPETAEPYRARLTWDLAAAGEGAVAVSSLGPGEVSGPLARLREAVFMAGPLGQLSLADPAPGVRVEGAWLGRPGFDPVEAIPWLARALAADHAFFRDRGAASLTLLLRAVPGLGPTWKASAFPGGMRVLAGEELGWTRAVRFGLARALLRRWIGDEAGLHFEGPEAVRRRLTDGLIAHVTHALLLRAGLATLDEIGEDRREHFGDPGLLYAADLDATIRAQSGGARSLDELVRDMVEHARWGGGPPSALPVDDWRAMVGNYGPDTRDRFDAAIVRGEPLAHAADAFLICLKPEKRRTGKAEALVWVRNPQPPSWAPCP